MIKQIAEMQITFLAFEGIITALIKGRNINPVKEKILTIIPIHSGEI
jgi:hypothetical protein